MKISTLLNHDALPGLQWIEVASSLQIPSFQIVGLPAPEVAESRERIRAAIDSSGFEFPRRRVVVNLSPASVKKRGTGLDLAVALGVLASDSRLFGDTFELRLMAWGELGLDGCVKSTSQLTRTLWASIKAGVNLVILPKTDQKAAIQSYRLIASCTLGPQGNSWPVVRFVSSLFEAWELIQDTAQGGLPKCELQTLSNQWIGKVHKFQGSSLLSLAPLLERAVCLSAAGEHHLMLLGPKGSGKSHAMEWLAALFPKDRNQGTLERTLLSELASGPDEFSDETIFSPPIRRVGPQTRPAALVGTVSQSGLRPGELSLAHGGILMADEFPEWPRDTREILREPLERGRISLARAEGTAELPAEFLFAGNGNLCPCGGWPSSVPLPLGAADDPRLAPPCRCRPSEQLQYLKRLSGPILDRIDLVLLVPAQSHSPSASLAPYSTELELREKVAQARTRLKKSWGNSSARLDAATLEGLCAKRPFWRENLESCATSSLRSRHKTLRIALTLAALEGSEEPLRRHFAEALCYRPERLRFSEA